MAERAVFYYDLSSPYAYLAAERISGVFAEAGAEQPIWEPVATAFIFRARDKTPWSLQPDGPNPADLREISDRAAERGLPEVVYPPGWPAETYSLLPIRAATYAKQSGRVVSFTLAAFRQAFAAGRPLNEPDNVLIAAAACELHPRAVLKGVEMRSVKDELVSATERAIALGAVGVPTVEVGGELFWGDDRLEDAAAAAAAWSTPPER
jgi:2-hydroxychromene-2-carboxylate isomerase